MVAQTISLNAANRKNGHWMGVGKKWDSGQMRVSILDLNPLKLCQLTVATNGVTLDFERRFFALCADQTPRPTQESGKLERGLKPRRKVSGPSEGTESPSPLHYHEPSIARS